MNYLKKIIAILVTTTQLILMPTCYGFIFESKAPQTLDIINSGTAALATRLAMIERAKKSIDLEYFIFRPDHAGQLILTALIRKARQGVKVRLLLDYLIGKKTISPFYAHYLEREGIQVKYFNTTPSIRLSKVQYRNHRKFLIVDRKEVITGGRNIGDEYFDMSGEYNFLDRDIYLVGSLAPQIATTFDTFWNSKLSKRKKREPRPEEDPFDFDEDSDTFSLEIDQQRWDKKDKAARDFLYPQGAEFNQLEGLRFQVMEFYYSRQSDKFDHTNLICKNTKFISDYPKISKKAVGIVKREILSRIEHAKKSITIDSPYFIMEHSLNKRLTNAMDRGVDLTVFTNGLHSTDAIYVSSVFYSGVKKWIKKGANIYIFRGFHPDRYPLLLKSAAGVRWGTHAKSFVFDGQDAMVTSFNFDPRSSNFNMEAGIFCDGNPNVAQDLQSDINFKMDNGRQLKTTDDIKRFGFKNTDFWKRLKFYLLAIPSELLRHLL